MNGNSKKIYSFHLSVSDPRLISPRGSSSTKTSITKRLTLGEDELREAKSCTTAITFWPQKRQGDTMTTKKRYNNENLEV